MEDSLKDKFKGTLFGQAIGDALGLGTEFMTKAEVRRCYPDGLADYSQIVQDCHRGRWRKGDWTDDTDAPVVGGTQFQAMVPARAYGNRQAYLQRIERRGVFGKAGGGCRKSLGAFRQKVRGQRRCDAHFGYRAAE